MWDSGVQMGRGPKGEAADCQKAERRTRNSGVDGAPLGGGGDGDEGGWGVTRPRLMRCWERAGESGPIERVRRKASSEGWMVKMA